VSQQLGALQTHTTDTFLFISHTANIILFCSEWDTLYYLYTNGLMKLPVSLMEKRWSWKVVMHCVKKLGENYVRQN